MIASADFRYAIPGAPSPWPAMVREPGVTRPNAAANCNGHRAAFDANALTPGADGEPPVSAARLPAPAGCPPMPSRRPPVQVAPKMATTNSFCWASASRSWLRASTPRNPG